MKVLCCRKGGGRLVTRTPPRRFPAAVQFPGGAGRVRCRHQALRHRTAQPGRRGAPRTHGTAPAGAGDAAGPSGLTSASPTTLHDWTRAGHLGKQAASSSRMAPQPGRHRWHPQASSGTTGRTGHHEAPLDTARAHQAPRASPAPTRPHQVSPNPPVPARQHQAPSRLTKYHWAPPGLARYPQSALGLAGYPQSPPGRPHEEQPRAHLPGVSTLRNSAQEINTAAPKPAPACLPQHNFTHRIFLSFFTNHKL